MTRKTARAIAAQLIYALIVGGGTPEAVLEEFFETDYYSSLSAESETFSEKPDKKQLGYINGVVTLAYEHREELDSYISVHSKGWKINRIAPSVKAILHLALCEILYLPDVPESVSVNEAIELARSFCGESMTPFVNGVLGSFLRASQTNAAEAEDRE